MTPELATLRSNASRLAVLFDRLELELVDDPAWGEPSDTSYLNDNDRKNPDIMANVEAMAATNRLISWFGRDMEGFVGLWRGPGDRALNEAPIVRLDTEGQYSIVARTIGDYIAVSVGDEDFLATRDLLRTLGLKVENNVDAIWATLEGVDDPNDFRNKLYEEKKVAAAWTAAPEPAPVKKAAAPVKKASPPVKKAAPPAPKAKAKPAPKKKAKPAPKKKAKPAPKKKAKPAPKKKAKPAPKKKAPAKK